MSSSSETEKINPYILAIFAFPGSCFYFFLSIKGGWKPLFFQKIGTHSTVITWLLELRLYKRLRSDNTMKSCSSADCSEVEQLSNTCGRLWVSASAVMPWGLTSRFISLRERIMGFGVLYGAWSLFMCLASPPPPLLDKVLQNPAVPLPGLQACPGKWWVPSVTPASPCHTLLLSGKMRYPSKATQVWLTAQPTSPCFASAHLTIHVVFWIKGAFGSIPTRWQQLLPVKPGRDSLVRVLWGTREPSALPKLFTSEQHCASLACLSV